MFVLVKLKDSVRIDPQVRGAAIQNACGAAARRASPPPPPPPPTHPPARPPPPQDLALPAREAVAAALRAAFVDKVVHGTGLVVSLYDLLEVEGGTVYPSDGGAHYTATFRAVVFRPFVGEVLEGRVRAQDPEGLEVDLGFFGDVRVPRALLPGEPAATWGAAADEWSWASEGKPLFFVRGNVVRVRVHAVSFRALPTAAEAAAAAGGGAGAGGAPPRPHVPMEVVARADKEGLGMLFWGFD